MIVPYGEPHPMHAWRTYFDAGEYGLGACTNSLALGCDCVGEIRYLDAQLVDRAGRPRDAARTRSACTRRTPACSGSTATSSRGASRCAGRGASSSTRWSRSATTTTRSAGTSHLDGSIECEVQLHGIVSTMALAPGEQPAGSAIVDRRAGGAEPPALLLLPPRPRRRRRREQRARGRVRGRAGRARRIRSATPSARASRRSRASREARRDSDERAARVWHVVNPARRNGLGGETGYRLVPLHGVSTMLAQPDARVSRRAGFARHTLWVTPPRRGRAPSRRAATRTAQPETVGLPQWSEADRPLEESDVVLWYTVGTTHFVRPEDWPIMPVARAGFRLEPVGFFDRNPSLDVPPPHACHGGSPAALDLAGDARERLADVRAQQPERDDDADRRSRRGRWRTRPSSDRAHAA